MQRALFLFRCTDDPDIESFLHNKAISHTDRGICNVFLILDEDCFDKDIIKIIAYFTLSHRSVIFCECVSNNRIRKITGFPKKDSTSVVLIGQIGKFIHENYRADISLQEILDYAYEIVRASSEFIPCRAILVECSETIYNLHLYEQAGFSFLQQDGDYYQYYDVIKG